MSEVNSESFDYIIVGGGSSGCIMANRLSASGKSRVLLVEAGLDHAPGAEPSELRDTGMRSLMFPQYFWNDLMLDDHVRPERYVQAKVMGGGSSINGLQAQRGLARDYDEWRQYGVEGWGWDDVLPYFKKVENDADMGGPLHGKDGLVHLCRVPEAKWSPMTKALREVCDQRGLPRLKDANDGGGDGTVAVPLSSTGTDRVSASGAYLTAEVRARSNLKIMSQTKVARLTFADRRASGIELEDGRRIGGANIVLCAGAVHTPALLLRSGIGPAAELTEAGIGMVADRAGVGRNLLNHPMLSIASHLKRAGRQPDPRHRPPVPMVVRYSSDIPGCAPTDMQINLWERTPGPLKRDPMGRQMSMLMLILQKSYSEGSVRLNPANPAGPLAVSANLLGDQRDLDRMVAGFRMCCEMLRTEPIASLVNNCFVPGMMMGATPDALTLKMLRDTLEARIISTAGAFAMDYVPGMRKKTMGKAGPDVFEILDRSDDAIVDFVRNIIGPGSHPGGTCRMGPVDNPRSVVDSQCRVIGVEGVRIGDASIFPTMMNAGTNLPVMMAAEKIADMILRDAQG